MKKYLILLLCLGVMLLVGCAPEKKADPREKLVLQALNGENLDYNFDAARAKVYELYQDDEKELQRALRFLDEWEAEREERISQGGLKIIEESIKQEYDSGYYRIIGSVQNNGSKNINYFELRLDLMDYNGKVLDSTYTNDDLTLRPGESRRFEFMYESIKGADQYTISVVTTR